MTDSVAHRFDASRAHATPHLELTGIYIYPVKSLRGVSLRDAPLENGRLVGDRNWLLVDAIGRFMHMRACP
jgi:uncharacterized protein YcbX